MDKNAPISKKVETGFTPRTSFDKELFKIGVTMNLSDRLRSLKQEFKIKGKYKLLLAIPVGSDDIEKDLLNAFEKLHPTLKINLNT